MADIRPSAEFVGEPEDISVTYSLHEGSIHKCILANGKDGSKCCLQIKVSNFTGRVTASVTVDHPVYTLVEEHRQDVQDDVLEITKFEDGLAKLENILLKIHSTSSSKCIVARRLLGNHDGFEKLKSFENWTDFKTFLGEQENSSILSSAGMTVAELERRVDATVDNPSFGNVVIKAEVTFHGNRDDLEVIYSKPFQVRTDKWISKRDEWISIKGDRIQEFGEWTITFGYRIEDLGIHAHKLGDRIFKLGYRIEDLGIHAYKLGGPFHEFGARTIMFGDQIKEFGGPIHEFGEPFHEFGIHAHKLGRTFHEFGARTIMFGDQIKEFGGPFHEFGDRIFKLGCHAHKLGDRIQEFGHIIHEFDEMIYEMDELISEIDDLYHEKARRMFESARRMFEIDDSYHGKDGKSMDADKPSQPGCSSGDTFDLQQTKKYLPHSITRDIEETILAHVRVGSKLIFLHGPEECGRTTLLNQIKLNMQKEYEGAQIIFYPEIPQQLHNEDLISGLQQIICPGLQNCSAELLREKLFESASSATLYVVILDIPHSQNAMQTTIPLLRSLFQSNQKVPGTLRVVASSCNCCWLDRIKEMEYLYNAVSIGISPLDSQESKQLLLEVNSNLSEQVRNEISTQRVSWSPSLLCIVGQMLKLETQEVDMLARATRLGDLVINDWQRVLQALDSEMRKLVAQLLVFNGRFREQDVRTFFRDVKDLDDELNQLSFGHHYLLNFDPATHSYCFSKTVKVMLLTVIRDKSYFEGEHLDHHYIQALHRYCLDHMELLMILGKQVTSRPVKVPDDIENKFFFEAVENEQGLTQVEKANVYMKCHCSQIVYCFAEMLKPDNGFQAALDSLDHIYDMSTLHVLQKNSEFAELNSIYNKLIDYHKSRMAAGISRTQIRVKVAKTTSAVVFFYLGHMRSESFQPKDVVNLKNTLASLHDEQGDEECTELEKIELGRLLLTDAFSREREGRYVHDDGVAIHEEVDRQRKDEVSVGNFSEDSTSPRQQEPAVEDSFSCGFLKACDIYVADSSINKASQGYFETGSYPYSYTAKNLLCKVATRPLKGKIFPVEFSWENERLYLESYAKYDKQATNNLIDDKSTVQLQSLVTSEEGKEREEEREIALTFVESTYVHRRAVRDVWMFLSEEEKRKEFLANISVHPSYIASFELHVAVITADQKPHFLFYRRPKAMPFPVKYTCGVVEDVSAKDYVVLDGEPEKTYVSLLKTAARGLSKKLGIDISDDELSAIHLHTIYVEDDTHDWGICGFVNLGDERIAQERRETGEALRTRLTQELKEESVEMVDVDFTMESMLRFLQEEQHAMSNSGKLVTVKAMQAFFGSQEVENAFAAVLDSEEPIKQPDEVEQEEHPQEELRYQPDY